MYGILINHEKEMLPFLTTWLDLIGIILSEISQTEEGKNCMVSLTCEIEGGSLWSFSSCSFLQRVCV